MIDSEKADGTEGAQQIVEREIVTIDDLAVNFGEGKIRQDKNNKISINLPL